MSSADCGCVPSRDLLDSFPGLGRPEFRGGKRDESSDGLRQCDGRSEFGRAVTSRPREKSPEDKAAERRRERR